MSHIIPEIGDWVLVWHTFGGFLPNLKTEQFLGKITLIELHYPWKFYSIEFYGLNKSEYKRIEDFKVITESEALQYILENSNE